LKAAIFVFLSCWAAVLMQLGTPDAVVKLGYTQNPPYNAQQSKSHLFVISGVLVNLMANDCLVKVVRIRSK
jgi:hypothetical protein